MKIKRRDIRSQNALLCSVCGNADLFVEVMEVETHLVNGRKDYIRLLDGVADHYLCWICGSKIQDTAPLEA